MPGTLTLNIANKKIIYLPSLLSILDRFSKKIDTPSALIILDSNYKHVFFFPLCFFKNFSFIKTSQSYIFIITSSNFWLIKSKGLFNSFLLFIKYSESSIWSPTTSIYSLNLLSMKSISSFTQ